MAGRTQPPYATQARHRLSASQATCTPGHGTLFVHAGHGAWDWKDDSRAFVLSPNFQDIEACDWSVCALATQPVLIINRGATDDHLGRLARACLRDGARRVLVLQPPARSALFVAKEVTHGAR